MGATTRVETVDFPDLEEFLLSELMRRTRAGIPKARVFPLPVSAIPTTSRPSNAGGQVHA